jgi:hypothetical protein
MCICSLQKQLPSAGFEPRTFAFEASVSASQPSVLSKLCRVLLLDRSQNCHFKLRFMSKYAPNLRISNKYGSVTVLQQ